jgi:hypothetical protein
MSESVTMAAGVKKATTTEWQTLLCYWYEFKQLTVSSKENCALSTYTYTSFKVYDNLATTYCVYLYHSEVRWKNFIAFGVRNCAKLWPQDIQHLDNNSGWVTRVRPNNQWTLTYMYMGVMGTQEGLIPADKWSAQYYYTCACKFRISCLHPQISHKHQCHAKSVASCPRPSYRCCMYTCTLYMYM